MLSDTEFKGEGPAPSGSRPPLVIATTKLTINSTLITLEGRQGTTDHVTFLKLKYSDGSAALLSYTEVIEILGERPQITGTPPTAQTSGPNWLISWLEAPHLIVFGRTEAIFEFRIWGLP